MCEWGVRSRTLATRDGAGWVGVGGLFMSGVWVGREGGCLGPWQRCRCHHQCWRQDAHRACLLHPPTPKPTPTPTPPYRLLPTAPAEFIRAVSTMYEAYAVMRRGREQRLAAQRAAELVAAEAAAAKAARAGQDSEAARRKAEAGESLGGGGQGHSRWERGGGGGHAAAHALCRPLMPAEAKAKAEAAAKEKKALEQMPQAQEKATEMAHETAAAAAAAAQGDAAQQRAEGGGGGGGLAAAAATVTAGAAMAKARRL